MADTVTVSNPGTAPRPSPSSNKEHRRNPNRWLHWVVTALILVLVVGLILLLRRSKPKAPPPRPISVTVTNVQTGDIQVAVTALGSVTPVYTDFMAPRVDGQLISVNYTEGQMVKTNDLLVVIDPGPYAALLTEAQGQLERDKALLEGAQIDLERYKTAYVKKAIPKQQYDDQLALVHQDQGTVKYDEGQVASAKVQVDYCYVRAPISGRVGLRLVDPGNVVHAANTNAMVVITQLQPITVLFNIAEDYLPQIEQQLQQGNELVVEAYDRDQTTKLATGSLLTLNNMIDVATGTIRLRAVFPNTDFSLFPNQFVNARLVIETLHGSVLVPTFAVQRNSNGAFVYLVTPTNTVTMRPITTGTAEGDVTAVTKGLEAGEIIALDNYNKLSEGAKITENQPAKNGQSDGKKKHGSHQKPAAGTEDSP
jgi:multidrug efflux system membrane fusion protein